MTTRLFILAISAAIKIAVFFFVSFTDGDQLLVRVWRRDCVPRCACRSQRKSDMMVGNVSALLFPGFSFLTRVAEYTIPLVPRLSNLH